MIKAVLLGALCATWLWAADVVNGFLGEWKCVRRFENGRHIETERIRFNPGSFAFTLSVDIGRGEYSVKGLQIEATGIWKASGETLVTVVEQIRLKSPGKVKNINESSLGRLIQSLRNRYLSDPIRIYRISHIDGGAFGTVSENGQSSEYSKLH